MTQHCRPISQTPALAQTALEAKLEAFIVILDNYVLFFGTLGADLYQQLILTFRGLPWKP